MPDIFSCGVIMINRSVLVGHKCPTYNNGLFLQLFMKIKQDSRLHGNDGISYFSGCLLVYKTRLGSLKTCFANLSYNSIFQRYFDAHDC